MPSVSKRDLRKVVKKAKDEMPFRDNYKGVVSPKPTGRAKQRRILLAGLRHGAPAASRRACLRKRNLSEAHGLSCKVAGSNKTLSSNICYPLA